jgi:hypothetical protein
MQNGPWAGKIDLRRCFFKPYRRSSLLRSGLLHPWNSFDWTWRTTECSHGLRCWLCQTLTHSINRRLRDHERDVRPLRRSAEHARTGESLNVRIVFEQTTNRLFTPSEFFVYLLH